MKNKTKGTIRRPPARWHEHEEIKRAQNVFFRPQEKKSFKKHRS